MAVRKQAQRRYPTATLPLVCALPSTSTTWLLVWQYGRPSIPLPEHKTECCFWRQRMSESKLSVYDCVVIGGGLSGLIAARNLHRLGKNILLIEARDRIGGRMHGRRLQSGQWIDLGGQWVGPTQDRILALLDEYGVRRFPSPVHGRTVLLFNGERHEFRGLFQGFYECEAPGVTDAEWHEVTEGWDRFHALSESLGPGYPVAGELNQRLDSDTFARWIEENTQTDFGRWYFAYMARAVGFMGPAEPNQVSLLHVLWGQKCAPQADHPEADRPYVSTTTRLGLR